MRILHVAQSISGGIASYFEEIANYQSAQLGAEKVRFLIPAGSRHHIPSVKDAQIVEFSPCARSVRGLLALARAFYREVSDYAPQIVHLHSTFAGAIARPVALMCKHRPRTVYCAHGWVFAMEIPTWKQKLFAAVERGLAPLTDAIVNISNADHELALRHGLPNKKMVTIRNGIAADQPVQAQPLEQFDKPGIHLLFVGRHDRQKGLDILLQAFSEREIPNVYLHVVGAPVLETESNIQRRPNPSNLLFYGWQPREAVANFIARADALIVPSRWEGFGLVALEAMRLAKPVIASRRGGLVEVVQHGKTGFHFDLDEIGTLRDLLIGLDKRTLEDMGKAAHKEFVRSFTSERLNSELFGLYQNLVESEIGTNAISWSRQESKFQRV